MSRRIALFLGSLILSLLAVEVVARLFVALRPGSRSLARYQRITRCRGAGMELSERDAPFRVGGGATAYERFYFPAKYGESPLLDGSILYKLTVKYYYDQKRRSIRKALVNPESEALRVSRALFDRVNDQVRQDGGRFILVVLPSHSDLRLLHRDAAYVSAWEKMIKAACDDTFACIDLTTGMLQAPPHKLDRGYDGSHYGPRANRLIADSMQRELAETIRGLGCGVPATTPSPVRDSLELLPRTPRNRGNFSANPAEPQQTR